MQSKDCSMLARFLSAQLTPILRRCFALNIATVPIHHSSHGAHIVFFLSFLFRACCLVKTGGAATLKETTWDTPLEPLAQSILSDLGDALGFFRGLVSRARSCLVDQREVLNRLHAFRAPLSLGYARALAYLVELKQLGCAKDARPDYAATCSPLLPDASLQVALMEQSAASFAFADVQTLGTSAI